MESDAELIHVISDAEMRGWLDVGTSAKVDALMDERDALREALRDVLPYARACIGLPESSWPSDSVILKARKALGGVE